MKRPIKTHMLDKKGDFLFKYYKCEEIDPLLDELEALRNAEPFPTFEEYEKWWDCAKPREIIRKNIYSYFAKFKTIEVMPEVGREYEGVKNSNGEVIRGQLDLVIDGYPCRFIRPIATPTREYVIAKAKELGLSEAELEVLCNTK
jgi:hypothetical protein